MLNESILQPSRCQPSWRRFSLKLKLPMYDVFRGSQGEDAKWLESVEGLEEPCERMRQEANKTPGKYFVFSVTGATVLATVDTSIRPAEKTTKRGVRV